MVYHMVYTIFRSSSPAIPAQVQPYTVCFRIQPVDPSAGLRLISIPRAQPVRCGPVRPIETGPSAVRCGPVQPIKTGPVRCGPLKFDRVGILVETQSVFHYPDHNGPIGPPDAARPRHSRPPTMLVSGVVPGPLRRGSSTSSE